MLNKSFVKSKTSKQKINFILNTAYNLKDIVNYWDKKSIVLENYLVKDKTEKNKWNNFTGEFIKLIESAFKLGTKKYDIEPDTFVKKRKEKCLYIVHIALKCIQYSEKETKTEENKEIQGSDSNKKTIGEVYAEGQKWKKHLDEKKEIIFGILEEAQKHLENLGKENEIDSKELDEKGFRQKIEEAWVRLNNIQKVNTEENKEWIAKDIDLYLLEKKLKKIYKIVKTRSEKYLESEMFVNLDEFKVLKKRIEEITGTFKIENISKLTEKTDEKSFINISETEGYFPLLTKLMTDFGELSLENRVRRYVSKRRLRLDWQTKKPRKWRSPVIFYKRKTKYRRKRFRKHIRFQAVHWYFPSYIYFDSRTLRAVFLHNPRPEEIKFSFKCSLPRVHAFYKGLGY